MSENASGARSLSASVPVRRCSKVSALPRRLPRRRFALRSAWPRLTLRMRQGATQSDAPPRRSAVPAADDWAKTCDPQPEALVIPRLIFGLLADAIQTKQ